MSSPSTMPPKKPANSASVVTALKTTIFTTPVLSRFLGWMASLLLKLAGWKAGGEKPDLPKYIAIAAPHTSNWDFILFVLVSLKVGFDAHWMGKHTLFAQPFTRLAIWLGGIPIDRSKSNDVVGQMVQHFASVDKLTVLIPPEGTRSKVKQWKTGFYHIAHQAQLPIVLGYIDAANKTAGFGPLFYTTGDVDADMQAIQLFYRDMQGIKRENT